VWPENVEAVRLFCDVATQWRVAAGFGVVYLGLDYAAVEAAMRMRGVKRRERSELFEKVRVMELAAKQELNARTRA
jgi:hypothetical protein